MFIRTYCIIPYCIYLYMFSPCIATWGPSATNWYGWLWDMGCWVCCQGAYHLAPGQFLVCGSDAACSSSKPSKRMKWSHGLGISMHFAAFRCISAREDCSIVKIGFLTRCNCSLSLGSASRWATLQIIQQKSRRVSSFSLPYQSL